MAPRLSPKPLRATSVPEVLRALDELRKRAEHGATRAAVVNLVVVAADPGSAERAAAAMRRLGPRHPGRTIVVCASDEASLPGAIDASVALHGEVADGRSVWWDEVTAAVGPEVWAHLESLVAPLTLPDLPVAVWYPGPLPRPDDGLLAQADLVLVDARFAGEAARAGDLGLAGLAELARHKPVADLSWKRLSPWRRLCASLFDDREWRGFLDCVERAEVAAHAGPRHLLAGWLADRLGLERSRLTLAEAVHASMRLEARAGGRRARFVVERPSDDPLVRARVELGGKRVDEEVAVLPEHGLTRSLAEALGQVGHDPVYVRALAHAVTLEARTSPARPEDGPGPP